MATMAENVIAAGSENRPLMLEKGMYDSWKTQSILYIRGKENGEMLMDSINKRPFQLKAEIIAKAADGVTDVIRAQTVKDLSPKEKLRYDSIEMSKQERESMLYDEFDKFTYEPGESIHSYYLRYAKLITDLNIIPMSMSNMQINTKFVNHLQPKRNRFVIAAKQARDLHVVNFDQLYAFLKHNEKERSSINAITISGSTCFTGQNLQPTSIIHQSEHTVSFPTT
ncbi:hypothetical protein Tco_0821414 [Tanacetum coccineum]|uniref:Gag-Pol polyprotein n=1 Tax=Tanacetum coccineum TaxID=301880 RepID=A0ABQ5AC59_9ASTR